MSDTLDSVLMAIRDSWSAETVFSTDDWSSNNPERGQCAVSALVVQDYLGGELKKYRTTFKYDARESHYTNVLADRTEVDVSRSQYPEDQQLVESAIDLKGFSSIREKLFSEANTKQRYELLKSKVARNYTRDLHLKILTCSTGI